MRNETEAADPDQERLAAELNQISARQGFPDGDPRAGPFDQSQIGEARRYMNAADRRSTRLSADLYAVRLQYGRGVGRRRAAAIFAVSDGVIATRKDLAGPRKWIPNMSERDRRSLARQVWLGGLLWEHSNGRDADEAALRAASEWKNVEDEEKDIWLPQDQHGEGQTMTVHREIADDAYYTEQDPYRDERIAMLAKLEAEFDAIDALADAEDDAVGEGAEKCDAAPDATGGDGDIQQSE